MDTSEKPTVPASDEWPQEPDGFYNIKFGATKEDAEKFVTFEQYGISGDWWGLSDELPYPTQGVTHFKFADADITAHLIFHPTGGLLHCIHATFPTDQFGGLKSAFLNLYGEPRDASSEVRQFSEIDLESLRQGTYPPLQRHCEATLESMRWYSDKVFISLVSQEQYAKGSLLIATWSYMKSRSGGEKMRELAERKLVCTRDEYTPPAGWTQEPDNFNGLKLGMTKAEADSRLTFSKCIPTKDPIDETLIEGNLIYETTWNIGGSAIPGEVLFINDRLINLGGKFDRSLWNAVKDAFIDFYGRPHVDERREIFEQGLSRRLEWNGDRVQIGLMDFPDGTAFARFWLQHTLKGQQLQIKLVGCKAIPPPEPPKIGVEHTESKLRLHLPEGATLDYPRDAPSPFLLQSTWHRNDDGRFVYDFDIDVSDVSRIDIGDGVHSVGSGAVFSQPNGWLSSARGWMHYDTALESTDVSASKPQTDIRRFSITSSLLPGPMSIQLVKDANIAPFERPIRDIPFTLSRRLYDAVRKTLHEQLIVLNNTFIIGPAIAPNSTEVDLRLLVQAWIDSYGFDFLKPVLQENGTLSANLDQLEPATDFEREIVECLRRVV